MASDIQSQVERVKDKTRVLCEKYNSLRASYEAAREEISQLRATLLARDEALEQLRIKVEYLTVASNVRASSGELEQTRTLIAGLIREIDRAIADIMD